MQAQLLSLRLIALTAWLVSFFIGIPPAFSPAVGSADPAAPIPPIGSARMGRRHGQVARARCL